MFFITVYVHTRLKSSFIFFFSHLPLRARFIHDSSFGHRCRDFYQMKAHFVVRGRHSRSSEESTLKFIHILFYYLVRWLVIVFVLRVITGRFFSEWLSFGDLIN